MGNIKYQSGAIGILGFLLLVLAGCVTPQETQQYVQQVDLWNTLPEAGEARVVVLREKGLVAHMKLYVMMMV